MNCRNFKYCDVGAAGAAGFVGADLCVCPSYPASALVLPCPCPVLPCRVRKKMQPPLGVVSRLRRAKSKAPALQRLFCKAGALLLTRRSVDATPSGAESP
jgi:hypothetical protein